MVDKEMLEAIGQLLQPINDRLEKIDKRLDAIDERTTKIEIHLENVTDKNIQRIIDSQTGISEKFQQLDEVAARVEDIQITVNAMEAVTKQNCTDIKQLRLAK